MIEQLIQDILKPIIVATSYYYDYPSAQSFVIYEYDTTEIGIKNTNSLQEITLNLYLYTTDLTTKESIKAQILQAFKTDTTLGLKSLVSHSTLYENELKKYITTIKYKIFYRQ